MPSRTFMNLPEEKKNRIYKAIYTELVRVPYPEMSINQVIKNAGIPRGSFYQYFESKEDAFEFFVEKSSENIMEAVMRRISTVHGSIFELCETVFDEIVNAGTDENLHCLSYHVVPYVNIGRIEPLSAYIEKMEPEKRVAYFCSLGIAGLDVKNEEEIMDIISVLEAIFQSALPQIFYGTEDRDIIREKFVRKLNIVKKATLREGN